jgi:hypothetical protein
MSHTHRYPNLEAFQQERPNRKKPNHSYNPLVLRKATRNESQKGRELMGLG